MFLICIKDTFIAVLVNIEEPAEVVDSLVNTESKQRWAGAILDTGSHHFG